VREDAQRYRETNGVQILVTLWSLAINALRLDGIWSITEGIAALAHDIRGMLKLLGRGLAVEMPQSWLLISSESVDVGRPEVDWFFWTGPIVNL